MDAFIFGKGTPKMSAHYKTMFGDYAHRAILPLKTDTRIAASVIGCFANDLSAEH